jgi:hypothetical protein
MADELGADGRLVAFMQYLRVLVVVLTAPVLAHLLLHPSAGGAAISGPGGEGSGSTCCSPRGARSRASCWLARCG